MQKAYFCFLRVDNRNKLGNFEAALVVFDEVDLLNRCELDVFCDDEIRSVHPRLFHGKHDLL